MSIYNTQQQAEQLKKALQAHQRGDLKEAQLLYKSILTINPDHFDALQLLATSYAQQKEAQLALDYFEKAMAIDASKAFLFNNLGNVLKSLHRYDDALVRYNQAIDLNPNYAEAYQNRANTQKAIGHFKEALKDYEQAIQLKPDYHEAYHYRALVYKELFKYEEAKQSLLAAINIRPNYIEAIYTLGIICRCQNQYTEAIQQLQLACSKKPHYADAWVELANTYIDVGRTDLAIQAFDRALAIDPQYPFLRGLRQYYRMQLCDWTNFSEELTIIKNEIEQGLPVCTPFPSHALLDCPRLQRKCAEIYATKLLPVASPKSEFPSIRQSPSKIRIAYFSSDFGNHPVTHLLVRLFELHSRDRFEVFGFSLLERPLDEWKRRVESSFDHFLDVSQMTDQEIHALSRQHQIDIAIDLNGYTKHARSSIFTHRVAPIQMSYLGFLGTMGSSCYDYLIADPIIVPDDLAHHYTEKILHLPFYQCNDDQQLVEDLGLTRKDMGLPENQFVFCSFNKPYKITPSMFSVWMSILRQVPKSVLWIYVGNDLAKDNLIRAAEKEGVDSQRLIFAKRVPLTEHLARLKLADLFLDSYPYNAGATASNALRAGLPMITLVGETFASRYGAVILRKLNLSELITTDIIEYKNLAVNLAQNLKYLKFVKDNLVGEVSKSSIFNTAIFLSEFEKSLQRAL